MNLRDLPPPATLRAFAALAEAGSMTGAGAALGVTHAAVSQQIRALEDHLGATLVRRQGRSVTLTEAGEELAVAVTGAFALMGDAVARISGRGAARPVQVSVTPMFAANWLMPRLATFRRRHPEVELMINPTSQLVELRPGGIDIAIRHGRGNWPGLSVELLLPSDFVVAAAPEVIGDADIRRPEDLLRFDWLQETGTDEVFEWLKSEGVTAARVKSLTHLPGNLLVEALRRGEGVAGTSRAMIEEDVAAGRLKILFDRGKGREGYHVVTRPAPLRPPAAAFARWLHAQKVEKPGAS